MTTLDTLLQARALLDTVTPLHCDCGMQCNAACCKSDDDEITGMLLFPMESMLYKSQDIWMKTQPSNLVLAGQSVPLLTCHIPCPRTKRPLACRIFPLTPYANEDTLTVRMDVRAKPMCPLYDSGLNGLDSAFVQAVKSAMRLLWADSTHRAYIRLLSAHLDEYNFLA